MVKCYSQQSESAVAEDFFAVNCEIVLQTPSNMKMIYFFHGVTDFTATVEIYVSKNLTLLVSQIS